MNLKSFLVYIISVIYLTSAELKTGGEKGEKEGCHGMCNEFVSFIYDLIQQKTFFNGQIPAADLYQLIKTQASEFCKKSYEKNNQCQNLVKRTWMIVVSLESGANVNDICSEIHVCSTGKSEPKESTDFAQHALKFCIEWRGNQPDAIKFCSKFSSTVKSVAGSLVSVAQNGAMSELIKCSPETNTLGCYVQQAPQNVKLTLALLTSVMPSPTALTNMIQNRYLLKSRSFCSFENGDGSGEKRKNGDSVFTQETCRGTCNIIGKKLLLSALEENGFFAQPLKNMATFCQILNVTKREQCDKMAVHLKKFHNGFVTQTVNQLCFNNVCNSKQINVMSVKLQQRCKQPALSINEFTPVDARERTSGANQLKVTGIVWNKFILNRIKIIIRGLSGLQFSATLSSFKDVAGWSLKLDACTLMNSL